jgi:hypothetical protein
VFFELPRGFSFLLPTPFHSRFLFHSSFPAPRFALPLCVFSSMLIIFSSSSFSREFAMLSLFFLHPLVCSSVFFPRFPIPVLRFCKQPNEAGFLSRAQAGRSKFQSEVFGV